MDDDNLRSGVRSPISYALNDAVIYGEHEIKRPAINTEISAAASTSASLQYSQSPRVPEYKNASNSNNLRPPNSHTPNDTVVFVAVEAKRSARNIETFRAHYPEKSRTSEHNISTDLTRTHLVENGARIAVHRPPTTNCDQETSRRPLAHKTGTMAVEATRHLSPYEVTVRQVIEERERMRALRRERQIRYRKKKHDYMLRLEAETRILREQIKSLTQRRGSLCTVDSTKDNVWNVAVDYFKHFRFGLQAVGQFSTNSTIVSSVQLSFLRTALSPDVIFNTHQGIETIITHWRYITYAFQALEMTLDGLVRSVDGSLIAITRTSISISEHTLGSVFPYLCHDGDEDLNRLGGKLVGRRFHMLGETRFEWSAASQRVSSVTAQSDMLTPMLRLLGNLEDVSRVFHRSRVSSDFQWSGINPCIPVSY